MKPRDLLKRLAVVGLLGMTTASLAVGQGAFIVDHDWVATGGLAIGEQGTLHVATGAGIAVYDAGGVQLWHRLIEGVQNVALDSEGNTYGVGESILAKLDAGGTVQWTVAPEGQVRSVATDAEGHIYLAGYRDGLSGDQARQEDIIIAKYDTDGQRLWQFNIANVFGRCRYPCDRTQEPSIAVDTKGILHVVGYFTGTIDVDPGVNVNALDAGASIDVFVAQYDASGQYLNAFRVGGPTGIEQGHDIAVSATGDIYLTGYFLGTSDFDPGPGVAPLTSDECFDAFIAKYSPAGDYQWAVDIGGETQCAEAVGIGIALDQDDNVFVTGYYFDFNAPVDFDAGPAVVTADYVGEEDAFVVRYDAEGRFGWALGLGGLRGGMGLRMAANAEGLMHVLGFGCGRVSMGVVGSELDFLAGCRLFVSTYDHVGFVGTSVTRQHETPTAPSLSALYPNPFSQRAQFMLTLDQAAFVSVALYDAMGREVKRVHDGYLAGRTTHHFEVDGAGMPSGIYLLRTESAGHLATQRLVITH